MSQTDEYRHAYLLLAHLTVSARTAFALKSLDAVLKLGAQSARLVNKALKLTLIALGSLVVHVVQ